ncbi:MAG: phospho-N-acetylmuramoyl-pentapeptide-transferase, partial [Candidatus Omnitrophota bacterium]|nr:phospho-N-acetylmuramoyl-pentapeptide-transferase [Candidatus Omnitrophota bacterium]
MLYHWLYPLRDIFFGFNVFKYITFRSAGAAVTAFLISLLLGPAVIRWLTAFKVKEVVRRKHVDSLYHLHAAKEGTPTMGGILLLASVIFSTLLWADIFNKYILLTVMSTCWLGLIGFIDDYIKLRSQRSRELTALTKITGQIILGFLIGLFLFYKPGFGRTIDIPFFKNLVLNLGYFYIFFVVLVIVGSSNAVNL